MFAVDEVRGLLVQPRAYRRRGHTTPHMPVETAKCWRLLKIEPNAWAGGKGSCSVRVDLQAVGALEFLGEFYSLAKGFGPFLRGFWAGFRPLQIDFLFPVHRPHPLSCTAYFN